MKFSAYLYSAKALPRVWVSHLFPPVLPFWLLVDQINSAAPDVNRGRFFVVMLLLVARSDALVA